MVNPDNLLESTEDYLKALFLEVMPSGGADFDAVTPFGELGVDSFRVLRIIRTLEAEFGTLPKTLLFENFNIQSLAQYFVDKHAPVLWRVLSPNSPAIAAEAETSRAASVAQPVSSAQAAEDHKQFGVNTTQAEVVPKDVRPASKPLRLLERDLPRHPELHALIKSLYEQYKNEGCVSRGTRNIAPNLFIGSARKGYFNYSRCRDVLLVYAYTGPREYFPEIAAEILGYCNDKRFQLNLFVDESIDAVGGVAFSATPFGAVQRVLNIRDFSLDGGAMRRLRYQVAKFEKAGACSTREYRCGSDPAIDRDIAAVIDKWCAGKPMVNPLIRIVREEILAGSLDPQHRIFLTFLDGRLQNVILISAMCASLNGYLMDLEFYGDDMPLGGLEYAIVQIISILAAEGCDMLSLGGTYGVRLESSAQADPEVDKVLDDLHRQNIFNDEGNLQFKNKFRPENRTIYICRPAGSGKADNLIDIIMMIADPDKVQTPDDDNHNIDEAASPVVPRTAPPAGLQAAPLARSPDASPEGPGVAGDDRLAALAAAGFNPLKLAAQEPDFDLKTDSWAQLDAPFVSRQMAHLRSQLQQGASLQDSLMAVFPFKHFVLTESGRAADHVFCKSWPRKGVVLQNLLFPTCIFHQIDKGFSPLELPCDEAFDTGSSHVFKGNLSWDALCQRVETQAADIAYVCIETCDNAVGGHPVSLEHLRRVKALLGRHGIALVIDATRILENARCLIDHEPECSGKSLWEVARAILGQADVVIGSLAKDFCVAKGGLIATSDEALARRCQETLQQDGGGLDVIDRKLVALSLGNRRHIELQVARRMEAVASLWQALHRHGIPVVEPAGGHCVLVDVKRIAAFASLPEPVPSFLAWLYLNTGVRAGAHSVGMQKKTALNGLVRLAVPVGLKREQVEDVAARIVGAFSRMANIPELGLQGSASDGWGDVLADYALIRWHGRSAGEPDKARSVQAASPAPDTGSVGPDAMAGTAPAQPGRAGAEAVARAPRPAGTTDIAVVGVAGRYPKARDVRQLWANLRQGIDCVEDIPESRMARRAETLFTRRYRGGFIDDIDRFDSLFFNISPREAEALDPQERLFLEVAWEAIEDAGYYPESLVQEGAPRNVGVFVGAVWAMYQMVGVEQKALGHEANPNSFLWSIANRVSYWMNLTGPSMTVDTACSSSLTALYLACEAIRSGACSSAIVGGVNLDLHQHKFDINRAGGALSPDGVCRSFGADANGYVAGEGVGALLIKPLDRALADRDQIYGVIRAAVVNHGGRTSGYTVPNPKAQGGLISDALAQAGVDPRSIGYIEAHGTGTELGDPVEIAGLSQAFAGDQGGEGLCAIGSVKTNIGHLEAAAGVVGVTKVLLQMKHRQLVPSLHSARLNPHIDFAGTPFMVQQQLAPWEGRNVAGQGYPLRAGVSSFGAGGANAHVILEALELPPEQEPADQVHVFPLSARNEEQLRAMATRLRDFLAEARPLPAMQDLAFTLQHGRKSFEARVAIVTDRLPALIGMLDAYLAGREQPGIVRGFAKNADGLTKVLNRSEREQLVALLLQGRDPHKIAQLWADGLLSDCRGLPNAGGRRISLPTYPFADKRHWIGDGAAAQSAHAVRTVAGLHPLIDCNESTFAQQVFRKRFHGQEFVLSDHVVSGIPTLPGAAYLELARKAGELSAGQPVCRIRNVTWVSPLSLADSRPADAVVELKPGGDAVLFEVFSEAADGGRKLCAQGKLVFGERTAADEYLDLAAIRARCTGSVDAAQAYPLFDAMGMRYGPGFQVLQRVHTGPDEVLGELRLPAVLQGSAAPFLLHPSLLDASMQAGVMAYIGDPAGQMKVPYSIGEVEILHPLTPVCYSHVTRSGTERGAGAGTGVTRENVTIVDENGRVLARIRDSVGVPLANVYGRTEPLRSEAPAVAAEQYEKLYYAHEWEALALPVVPDDVSRVLLFAADKALRSAFAARGIATTLVLPGTQFEALGEQVFRIDPLDREHYSRLFASAGGGADIFGKICFAWPEALADGSADSLQRALERGVHAFLNLSQAVIDQQARERIQIVYLYHSAPDSPSAHHEAINGFVRSLRLESPKLDCKVLELRGVAPDGDRLADLVLRELHAEAQAHLTVRYTAAERAVRVLRRLDGPAIEAAGRQSVVLKHRGVYLITGGAGGLGLLFAEHLARTCQARIVLAGRSAPTPELQARLAALEQQGGEAHYVAADVATPEGVRTLLDATHARFGALQGVIHAAGVLRDAFVRKKTQDDLRAVLAPKVFGAFHLDEQTRHENLDFFVVFSSLAAIGGNAGQCDYAFANHYLDSFAAMREAQRGRGERSGRTVSINWSLWADGGMQLDAQTELLFRKNLGIVPLGTGSGLSAFAAAIAAPQPQLAVLEGVREKIEQAWGIAGKPAARAQASALAAAPGSGGEARLAADVLDALAGKVGELLKLDRDELSLDTILLDLGFDSIGLTTFANAINERYGLEINPVLFFEYPTLRSIADVLLREHREAIERVHGASAAGPAAAPPEGAVEHAVPLAIAGDAAGIAGGKAWRAPGAGSPAPALPAAPQPRAGALSKPHRFLDEPIAIVGIAGVMPQSSNVEAFWEGLRDERNLVTEIPRDRWIWEDYDGNPIKEVNKSNSRWGGFMREVDKFDPLFFGITPREAEMMDPQQRIFIETVCAAIEDSGHRLSDLSGTKTGLFVGVSAKDYVDVLAENQATLDGFSASGNSHSILANRVSFLLNLRGPSAPIDTACSSSLIALHRAIESIHTGSCDMAIVGGVQVMLTPVGHISLSSAGMLSVDGKCKTFDKDANGYVRGEGSGAVFIKKLAKAIEDGNPIYAVVKATAENHGGKVTMLTAPNPKAQAELLFEAYDKAQVDPATVGYIECHGTGTSLGDPIEIQALKKSFADLFRKTGRVPPAEPYCGLSSVKTNIGHLEPAAGIASLLKVLLAIKHQQIPALLHFDTLNPYIDLLGSPFYIVERTRPWPAPTAPDGAELPRRAGVSSFGWGGANAHIVLEEFTPPVASAPGQAGPQAIVLSARNAARLRDYAGALLAHVRKHAVPLAEMAYTLQVGRDAMEERLGVVAGSTDELIARLQAYLDGTASVEGLHQGHINRFKRNEHGLSSLGAADAGMAPGDIDAALAARDLDRLLGGWVRGGEVDWARLHPVVPQRISLPTYPYARDRHWIETRVSRKPGQGSGAGALHPLLHANVSTLGHQRFSSSFNGREFFVSGTPRTLSAAACLEMAHAAVMLARPDSREAWVIRLDGTVWSRPIVIHEQRAVLTDVFELRAGQLGYEIHSEYMDVSGQWHRVLHCEGSARSISRPPQSRLDTQQIRALMSYGEIAPEKLDALLGMQGTPDGAAMRAIETLHHGYHQLLARLALPAALAHTAQDYTLHPAMIETVLLSAAALAADPRVPGGRVYAPARIESLCVLSACPAGMYAWVRYARGSREGEPEIRMDVDLLDEQGTVCVQIRSLTLVAVRASGEVRTANEDFATLLDVVYAEQAGSGPQGAEAVARPHDEATSSFVSILEQIL